MAVLRLQDPDDGGMEATFGWSRWLQHDFVSIGVEGVSVPEPVAVGMAAPAVETWAALPRFDDEGPRALAHEAGPVICYEPQGWLFG